MDTPDSQSSWHIYCIKCDKRDALAVYLKEKGILTGVHYKPIHLYKCYGNTPSLSKSEEYFKRIMSLPMHPNLTDNEIYMIIEAIQDFYKE
jgi:perosamine synthetase